MGQQLSTFNRNYLTNYEINVLQLNEDMEIIKQKLKTVNDRKKYREILHYKVDFTNVRFTTYPYNCYIIKYGGRTDKTIEKYLTAIQAMKTIGNLFPKKGFIAVRGYIVNQLEYMKTAERCEKCGELFCKCS